MLGALWQTQAALTLHPGPLQVKCIVLQVLRGLQYLHRNFIIHRWAGSTGLEGGGASGDIFPEECWFVTWGECDCQY